MANTILQAAATAVREEGFIASEQLTPGDLVEFGGSDDIQVHKNAGQTAARMFVRAQEENQGAGIDDDIASGDEATVLFPQPGDKVLANSAGAISENAFVESAGDGRLQTVADQAATADEERHSVVGQALETTTGADERFEILVF